MNTEFDVSSEAEENGEAESQKAKNIRLAKQITCIVLCALFGISIIFNLSFLFSSLLEPSRPPSIFGATPTIIYSDSMEGKAEDGIPAGSFVFADGSDISEAREGDVIIFYREGSTWAARVTAEGEALRAKEDRAEEEYSFVITEEMYLGKVSLCATGFGQLAMFMNTWLGTFLFSAIPFVVSLVLGFIEIRIEVLRLIKYVKAKKAGKTGGEELSDEAEETVEEATAVGIDDAQEAAEAEDGAHAEKQ